MNNPARRLVSAVQNSLLGDLVGRLFFLVLWLQWPVVGDNSPAHFQAYATTFACFLVFIVLTWAIGFVSIHEKPRGRWLLERIRDAPRNGFEVWTRTPAGGPRPPRLIRAIVMALGRTGPRDSGWFRKMLGAYALAALAFILLRHFDRAALASLNPTFAGPGFYMGVFWTIMAVVIAAALRSWAVDSRKRLETFAGKPG